MIVAGDRMRSEEALPAAVTLYITFIIILIGAEPMLAFKITTVGASAGIIITKEAMARLKVKKGDTLFLTEAPDGGYRLTPYDPEFERQMRLADEIMHEDREILRALAK